MNKKLSMAVAGAVLAFASTANAGITIPAGDWTIDIGGNVNAFYTNTKLEGAFETAGKEDVASTIQTGLLPSALGIGGKTRQNDLDIAFQFTFFVGSDSANGSGAGNNSLNIRQSFLTFGDKSWGTIKAGRDLGIYGSDAILSDMTLLGVGVGAGGGGSSTLGRIGSGYMYADWVGQISYASPNWNGFSFAVGIREPWSNVLNASTGTALAPTAASNSLVRSDIGFEGKVGYEWAGDVSGKVWAGYIHQKHSDDTSAVAFNGYTSRGFDLGAKVAVAGFGLVGYYYDGRGLSGTPNLLSGIVFISGVKTDDKGGYVQGTYTIPGVGTKLGASWGVTKIQSPAAATTEFENKSWIVGAYHPLTKSLNLVAEYTHNELDGIGFAAGAEGERKTLSLGAIMFF